MNPTPTTTDKPLTVDPRSVEGAVVLAVRRCLNGETALLNTLFLIRGLIEGARRRPTDRQPARDR
jgi:hypothetical protein